MVAHLKVIIVPWTQPVAGNYIHFLAQLWETEDPAAEVSASLANANPFYA